MIRRRPLQLSLRKKLLFASIATVAFFCVLEAILAGLGIRPEAEQTDRTIGFSSYSPLMVPSINADGASILTTAQNKSHWFNKQSFPKVKAAGTVRIFCMGGSTTYGHPYWDETSFAGWLREYLPVVDPDHSWEVINAGGISYASYRVAALMEELAQYEPDIFIVYSVHNEFLERRTYADFFAQPAAAHHLTSLLSRTRVWTAAEQLVRAARERSSDPKTNSTSSPAVMLPGEVDEELNHTVGPTEYHRDDAWRADVVKHYQANLQRMIDIAKRSGAKIVFITPTANERDCSPFKSEMSKDNSNDQAVVEALLRSGDQAFDQSSLDAALASYRQAIKLDDRYAESYYRIGQVLLALSKTEEALTVFQRAIDEDVCPLRAPTEIDRAVRSIAKRNSIPLVDFQSRLRQVAIEETGINIFGNDLFLDHVHPTIEVNRRLATWIIDELQQNQVIVGKPVMDPQLQPELESIGEAVVESIDRDDEIFALRNLAKVLHWSGKFAEAIPRARDTLELAPNDPESRYIVASSLANLGRTEEALEEYDLLFADGVGYPRAYLPFGELLAVHGKLEQAKAYLLLAILRNPDSSAAYISLGKVHEALGEDKFAAEAFETAEKLDAR